MPLTKLQFRPGIVKDTTEYANEGGWVDCDKVRFRRGFPETIGGWAALSSASFLGSCRSLLPWFDLSGDAFIGVGTNIKYYVENGGGFFDITPLRLTTSAGAVTFAATSGSATLTVSHTGHNALEGDFVTFSGAVSLGGVITADVLNQEYRIDTIVDSDTYTITARAASTTISDLTVNGELVYTPLAAAAGDTGDGGASVIGAYQISASPDSTALGTGWGVGAWSREGWGEGADISLQASQLAAWSHDTFGEDLLLSRRGGPIYVWDTSAGTAFRAVDISTLGGTEVPVVANRILVSDRDRHVIAFGANPEGTSTVADLDPMLIRFSDQENYLNWQSTATNTAGSILLGSGSEIVTAVETRQQTLVFTDIAVYAMQYLGPPFTFGTSLIAKNTSILSPTAAVAIDDAVIWMGDRAFYLYDGAVRVLDCPVLNHVFDTMDPDETAKVTCGTNVRFSEIWWFYPCTNTGECTRYVVYNYAQQIWYIGRMPRSAWADAANGPVPVAASPFDGKLYYQETGFNDGSTDPATPLAAFIESAPIDIGDGEQFAFLSRVIPDVDFGTSTSPDTALTITTSVRNPANGVYAASVNNIITATTPQSYMRLRGRHFSVKISSETADMEWVLGALRYDMRTDGRR